MPGPDDDVRPDHARRRGAVIGGRPHDRPGDAARAEPRARRPQRYAARTRRLETRTRRRLTWTPRSLDWSDRSRAGTTRRVGVDGRAARWLGVASGWSSTASGAWVARSLELALTRPWLEVVGVIARRPEREGEACSDTVPSAPARTCASAHGPTRSSAVARPDVVTVATTSRLKDVLRSARGGREQRRTGDRQHVGGAGVGRTRRRSRGARDPRPRGAPRDRDRRDWREPGLRARPPAARAHGPRVGRRARRGATGRRRLGLRAAHAAPARHRP